ncbi:MAG: hypothetical protein G01um10142_266 [Parcubacteria group bacterium Gr01-1014_2]|nr:MAG: hypothetical protein G01um10142_266 [Parcubacteria group bacterium Gr01-1014_2]
MGVIFLFFSIPLLILTAGMAWIVSFSVISVNYIDQRKVGVILWSANGLGAFFMLKQGGLSAGSAVVIVIMASAIGFFFNSFLSLLSRPFKDPGAFETTQKTPIE